MASWMFLVNDGFFPKPYRLARCPPRLRAQTTKRRAKSTTATGLIFHFHLIRREAIAEDEKGAVEMTG